MGAAENRAEDQSHLQSLTYFRINKDLAEHNPNLLQSQVNLDLDNFWLVSRNLGLDILKIVVSTESRSR